MTSKNTARLEETTEEHTGMTPEAIAEAKAIEAKKAEETFTATFSSALAGFLPLKAEVTVKQDDKEIVVKPGANIFVGVKRVNQARTRAEVQILAMGTGVDMTKIYIIPMSAIEAPEKAKSAGSARQSTARVKGAIEETYYAALINLLGEGYSKKHGDFVKALGVAGGLSAEAIKALGASTFPGLTFANYQKYVAALAALTTFCNEQIAKAKDAEEAEITIDILSATVNHGHKVFAIARAISLF